MCRLKQHGYTYFSGEIRGEIEQRKLSVQQKKFRWSDKTGKKIFFERRWSDTIGFKLSDTIGQSRLQLRDSGLYRVRALLARQGIFAAPCRSVHFFSFIYIYRMYSVLVILTRLYCTQVETGLRSRRAPPPLISCPLAFIFPWIFPLVDFKGFVRSLRNVCTEHSLVRLLQLIPFTTCHPPFVLLFSSLYTTNQILQSILGCNDFEFYEREHRNLRNIWKTFFGVFL